MDLTSLGLAIHVRGAVFFVFGVGKAKQEKFGAIFLEAIKEAS